jgi:hypothetical protein
MRIMREDYDKTSLASHQPAVRSVPPMLLARADEVIE